MFVEAPVCPQCPLFPNFDFVFMNEKVFTIFLTSEGRIWWFPVSKKASKQVREENWSETRTLWNHPFGSDRADIKYHLWWLVRHNNITIFIGILNILFCTGPSYFELNYLSNFNKQAVWLIAKFLYYIVNNVVNVVNNAVSEKKHGIWGFLSCKILRNIIKSRWNIINVIHNVLETWHVLVRGSLNKFLFMHHFLDLNDIVGINVVWRNNDSNGIFPKLNLTNWANVNNMMNSVVSVDRLLILNCK